MTACRSARMICLIAIGSHTIPTSSSASHLRTVPFWKRITEQSQGSEDVREPVLSQGIAEAHSQSSHLPSLTENASYSARRMRIVSFSTSTLQTTLALS